MSPQRSTPAPFLTKTYQLVDDASTDDVISWSQSGNTFVVWKHAHFSKHLLPKYFKHNNFSSFVRQLNTYGFRKTVPDKWEFGHEYFKRGERNLLSEIKRRKTVSETAGSGKSGFVGGKRWASESGGEEMGSTSTGSVEGGRSEYACENEKLKKENEKLSSELRREKKQCQELVILLREALKVCPERCGSSYDAVRFDQQNQSERGSLKLFGVWLKGEVGKDNKDIGNCRQPSIAVYHACKKL